MLVGHEGLVMLQRMSRRTSRAPIARWVGHTDMEPVGRKGDINGDSR
jgi:hypothetical protein